MTSEDERFEDAASDTPQIDQWELDRAQKVQNAISSTADEAKLIDQIAEIRGWFGPSPDSVFYPIIQKYLNVDIGFHETQVRIMGYIDNNKAKNTESKTDEDDDDDDDEINMMDLWYSILHSAKRISFRTPDPHTKLVTLLQALKFRLDNTLPSFTMAIRESSNDQPGVGAGYSVPEAHAWANFNYFLALITRNSVADLWIYIIWAMRPALEENIKDDGPDDAHVPGTAVQKYDARVPAACVWILVLGKEIYGREEDLAPKRVGEGNPGSGGERWKERGGKAEFSKERWGFWKERLGEIAGLEDVGEEARKMAREAVGVMEEVEKK